MADEVTPTNILSKFLPTKKKGVYTRHKNLCDVNDPRNEKMVCGRSAGHKGKWHYSNSHRKWTK